MSDDDKRAALADMVAASASAANAMTDAAQASAPKTRRKSAR